MALARASLTFDDLGNRVEFTPLEYSEFAIRHKGDSLHLGLRPWLETIYNMPITVQPDGEVRRKVLLVFGRQSEKSTTLGNMQMSLANLNPYLRLLYVTASNEQMREFSDERLRAVINDSPVLQAMAGQLGRKKVGERETQNVQTKRWATQSKIVLRSVFNSPDRVRGISADMLCVDELQDVYADFLPVIEEVLFACQLEDGPISLYSGTPKTFDNPLENYWSRRSSRNEWMIRCARCGQWSIVEDANIGPRGLRCMKQMRGGGGTCEGPLEPVHGTAQWVRTGRSGQPWEGFRLPQPAAIYTSRERKKVFLRRWQQLLEKQRQYSRPKFSNEVMARSFDSGTKPVTMEQVRRCCLPDNELIYEPSEALRQTQTFAGVDWGCHDDQTEVLTESGWKFFRDVQPGEKVAQWDKNSRELSYAAPSRLTVKDYEGDLIHFTGEAVDMMLTPNHRTVSSRSRGDSLEVQRADWLETRTRRYLPGFVHWEGQERETFTLPGQPTSPGYAGAEEKSFAMDDWLELLGYFLSGGGLCLRPRKSGERLPYCIEMSQRASVNPGDAATIKACMDRMGVPYRECPNEETGDSNWTITGKQWWDWRDKNIGRLGSTKRIPKEFLDLPPRQLRILFDALMLGDGTRDQRALNEDGAYTSTSEGLIDDIQELCIRIGLRASKELHKPAEGNRRARWRLSVSRGRDHHYDSTRLTERVPYKGKVYCCTVPKEFIVTRRNGKVAFQGNTGDGSFTVLSIWTYDQQGRFKLLFAKIYEGIDSDPEYSVHDIVHWCKVWRATLIGADWGFGFYANPKLMAAFGPERVVLYQHVDNQREKFKWDKAGGKFTCHRSRVMQDAFTLIHRGPQAGGCAFVNWEQFEQPFAEHILNIFSDFSHKRRQIVYNHQVGNPDDFFQTFVYAFAVSQFIRKRPDLHVPGVKTTA